ncbi:MAG TPA: alpha/beta hydrolase [Mariniphaga anaerophila]|uniref:Alpha/beta hydrolase n=1 Tax=Mariniphaga anaerophila TaxID=1484053 RepID=A0A831PQ53_9BACT|nr:alpha/beta hydrolase [Mariniphaga anaerophila]
MKKKAVFIFIIFIFTEYAAVNAQKRYLHPVTNQIDTETHTYIIKNGEKLDMDIYLPVDDEKTDRPLLLFVHGGGFQSGKRNSEGIVNFCNRMACYGYITASMTYRLTRKDQPEAFECNCPVSEKMKTFDAAVEDIQDATFYLIQNYEYLGIDPNKIILAGSSAGAEVVLITAYSPPVCYDLPSGPVSYAGVISMAGAIPDTSIIYSESAVPSLFFHGTDDNLVPYASAPHHYCEKNQPGFLILHGSQTLANKFQTLEVPYWLHTTCGGGHELAGRPMVDYFNEIIDFCYTFVLNNQGEFRHTIIKGKEQNPKYKQFNFCE